MSAPTAGWPAGEPKHRPNLSGSFLPLLPRPKKVCRGIFYKWVRSGGRVGQGMKCLTSELWDGERCWQSPASGCSWTSWMLLADPGLALCSALFLGWSLLPCVSCPSWHWHSCGSVGKDEVVWGEAMQGYFCNCLSHHDPQWVAHQNNTRLLHKYYNFICFFCPRDKSNLTAQIKKL